METKSTSTEIKSKSKSKSKLIRVPSELIDEIKKRDNNNTPPGTILYDMYQKYVVLEEFAKIIAKTHNIPYNDNPVDIIAEHLNRLSQRIKEMGDRLDKYDTMLKGLNMLMEYGKPIDTNINSNMNNQLNYERRHERPVQTVIW